MIFHIIKTVSGYKGVNPTEQQPLLSFLNFFRKTDVLTGRLQFSVIKNKQSLKGNS